MSLADTSVQLRPPMLKKPTSIIWLIGALIISAVLDVGSTIQEIPKLGGWEHEGNPVFRAFGGATLEPDTAVRVVIGLKAISVLLTILWLGLALRRTSDLYPRPQPEIGFLKFANLVFYGAEVSWRKVLFGIPSLSRCYRLLSLPFACALIVGGMAAFVSNTLHLVNGLFGAIVFWLVTGWTGFFLGLEMLRQDFCALSRRTVGQTVNAADLEGG